MIGKTWKQGASSIVEKGEDKGWGYSNERNGLGQVTLGTTNDADVQSSNGTNPGTIQVRQTEDQVKGENWEFNL